MQFCIRDDDTCFFTQPEELERAYGRITTFGPVSLAVVPFCRAGTSKAVPEKFRERWSIHPLHENVALVQYLRNKVAGGAFEIMLHGYHHDEPHGLPEFSTGRDLHARVVGGVRYLEDLFSTPVKVFVPPHNAICRRGLRALARERLHFAGAAGLRGGWPLLSPRTWALWRRLRTWRHEGGLGVPWVLDLGDHREIAGNAVTPLSALKHNQLAMDRAFDVDGVFCAATHYWELEARSSHPGDPTIGDHLLHLIERAMTRPGTTWQSVGDIVSQGRIS